MIDVNKIRSMKTLEAMQKVLSEFLGFDHATMVEVYAEDYGWGEEDFEADKDNASYLLEQIEKRMKSLGRHLSKGKAGKSASQSASPESPDASPA
jgi:hypothetical protein